MEPEGSLPQSQVPANCPYPAHQSISPGSKLTVWLFRNIMTFLRWEVISPSPKPQAGGPTPVGYLLLLIQYIRSHPPYWRLLLHPQPEDAGRQGPTYRGFYTGFGRNIWRNGNTVVSGIIGVGSLSLSALLARLKALQLPWSAGL